MYVEFYWKPCDAYLWLEDVIVSFPLAHEDCKSYETHKSTVLAAVDDTAYIRVAL